MKLFLAAILSIVVVAPAMGETCHEKFVRIYTDRNVKGPTKNLIVQEIKGAKPTRNYNYMDGTGDWMTEMIEPSNMPWSMVRGQVMYASYDKGKSWKKIRTLDSGHDPEAVAKQLKAAADTAKNAACATEELDGVMYETIEADYEQPAFKSSYHDKFWVNPETGWIAKSTTLTKQAGFESFSTQVIEKAPGLKLPVP